MRKTISMELIRTLSSGKERLGKDTLQRVTRFVESQKTMADTFKDKSGEPDLYYTSFGWLLSYVLGIELDTERRENYLRNQPVASLDLVHYAAYMRCRMLHRLMSDGKFRFLINTFRSVPVRDIDSFASLPHNDIGSPYTRFIWLSLLEDTRNEVEDRKQILERLEHYQTPGGGYSNMRYRKVATTNATAAALMVVGQLRGYEPNPDLFYLRDSQDETGGFKAGMESPVPDLLSTATALFAMRCYGIRANRSASDFIEAHWLESGGFSATLLEDVSDVEYVFYGLLALGAL